MPSGRDTLLRGSVSVQNVDETGQTRQAILELLPNGSPLHRYVQWACAAHGSPAIYHVGCALSLLLYELTWRGFRLPKVVDEGEYALTAQFLLIGGSATGKTTSFNMMQDFARSVWAATATRPELDPWLELEGSIEGITSAIQERYDERLDSTPVILFDSEISKVFARREPLTELLCKLADGRTIQSNFRGKQRKVRDPNADRIVNPRCCGIFCTTEAQLAPHFKDSHRMGGSFPRLIWLRPDFTRADIWLAQDHLGARSLSATRQAAIHDWSGWLVELELAAAEQGRKFEFTAEAHAVLSNELFSPFANEFTTVETDDNMHAVKMRLLEKARAFAVLSAAMRFSLRVLPDDVMFAAQLVRLLLSMHTLTTVIRDLGSSDDYRVSKRLETLIRATGDEGSLRRELYGRTRLSKKAMDDGLAHLIDREVVFVDNTRPGRTGRYVHIDSPLGQQMQKIAREQEAEEAELAQTLGAGGITGVTQRPGSNPAPAWRRFRN